jgi:hypothetical protein
MTMVANYNGFERTLLRTNVTGPLLAARSPRRPARAMAVGRLLFMISNAVFPTGAMHAAYRSRSFDSGRAV